MRAISSPRLPSIRTKIALLVLACAIPAALGYGLLLHHFYQRERDQAIANALQMARALANTVDLELANGETAAHALTASPALRNGNLLAFHTEARQLLRAQFPGTAFVLSDAAGRQLVNTSLPYGLPLPPRGDTGQLRQVFEQGKTVLSDLLPNAAAHQPELAIDVPVWSGGKVAYDLAVAFSTEHLGQLLRAQQLPPNVTLTLLDGKGVVLARTRLAERFVGRKGRQDVLDKILGQHEGTVSTGSLEGIPIYLNYSRAPRSGWTVAVNIPRETLLHELLNSVSLISGLVGALLLAGMALAWWMGGRIARSVRALASPQGAPAPASQQMYFREAEQVATALHQLTNDMLRHRQQLENLVAQRTAALEQSNGLLASVYDTAPVGLCLLDRELRFVAVNAYLAAIDGLPVAAHIGQRLPALIGPVGNAAEQVYRDVIGSGVANVGIELSGSTPAAPQEIHHWMLSVYPVADAAGQITGATGVVLEITDRKHLETRLRDSGEYFRVLYESARDAHLILDPDGAFVGANPAAVALLGCADLAALLALSPAQASAAVQPDGRRSAEMIPAMLTLALERGGHAFEWLLRRRDGSELLADVLLNRLNVGGRQLLQATMRDITERRQAEQALRLSAAQLRESERFIHTITDNLPGMVAYWDAAQRCRFANKRYLEVQAKTLAEAMGAPMDELLGPSVYAASLPYVEGVLAGQPQNFAREWPGADGVSHHWASYIPDIDADGEVRGFFALIADVTVLKQAELRLQELNEELVRSRDKAEAASRAKSDFVANMSHEIRTPMNAIIGLARLLEEAPLERRERSYVAKIKLATQALLGVLNDVLDFSKIEAGRLVLEQAPFKLDDVLASSAVLVASHAWSKGVEPIFEVAPDVPAELVGDAMRLQQVLLNLIGNAVKFTERGEVLLSIARVGRGVAAPGSVVTLSFNVRDTGIGITPEQQRHIFDAFSQGDNSTSRRYGGSGLGLAICRRLVTLMGGVIGVHSEPGKGALFRFTGQFVTAATPASALDADGPTAPAPTASGPLTILVVDDNATLRRVLQHGCAAHGWQADTAPDGAAALAMLRGGARRYDLLLLDSAMPGMDGIATLMQARAMPGLQVPPVVMMVADDRSEDLAQFADGMDLAAILSKPATPASLRAAVTAAMTAPRGAAPALAMALPTPLSGRLSGMRVLLVEDNEINQEMAQYILLHAGARVAIAANGQLAVDRLAAGEQYDAVLMDIQMPVLNGYDATRAIRAMGLARLPIVAMTANAMADDRQRAADAGTDGHISKPIDVDELIATLTRLTGHASGAQAWAQTDAHAELPTGAQAAAPWRLAQATAASPHDGGAGLPAQLPGIDMEAALRRFGGNATVFVGLLKRFENSQGDAVADTRRLLAAGQRQEAVQVLHRLRGVAANLGANQIAALSSQAGAALEGGREVELATLMLTLDRAMALAFAAARTLPLPAPDEGVPTAPAQLADALAELLALLHNNNMKALPHFQALRAALELREREAARTLAEAVETLGFDRAAVLVEKILQRI